MVKVDDWKSPILVEAILVWTGWGRYFMPRRDDTLIVTHFGAKVASELLPVIKSIEKEFYASEAIGTTANLVEMGRMAEEDFRKKYPEVADDIVKALAWCYTFDFK